MRGVEFRGRCRDGRSYSLTLVMLQSEGCPSVSSNLVAGWLVQTLDQAVGEQSPCINAERKGFFGE